MMGKKMWDKVTPKNLIIVLLVEQCHLLQKVPLYIATGQPRAHLNGPLVSTHLCTQPGCPALGMRLL